LFSSSAGYYLRCFLEAYLVFLFLNQTFRLIREAFLFPILSNSTKATLTIREAFLLSHFLNYSKADFLLREAFFLFLFLNCNEAHFTIREAFLSLPL
jgi:hypothetical protein